MPVRNAPSAVPTTLRFMAARLRHRLFSPRPASAPDLRTRMGKVFAALQARGVQAHWIQVPAGGDWLDGGIDLLPGEAVAILAEGMVWLAKGLDVGFGPQVGLWYRVGDAPLRKTTSARSWLDAGEGGRLRFTTKPPGEFASRDGRFEADLDRKPLQGGFTVAVLRWPAEPDAALDHAASVDEELFASLRQQRRVPARAPQGWHYLWRLGDGNIFRAHEQHNGRMCCQTHADVGILQFPVDHALDEGSRLDWRWLVQRLPSALPEHTAPTHDYLSIALEFDNGLDLTWMWSSGLPEGTIFQCPLPWWDQRETHWVLRSDPAKLGQWLDESRPILADYRKAIGGPDPTRIVAVWLIANTAFQRGHGHCEYEGIVLRSGAREDHVGG
ncbi:DUF3047 domain-containing protein [Piscinibacter sp.]|uniref:DUF3047 domain-containing protein n=1 Tax=Piscinibacter sp. TaxID=1903157 RepID=UPI0039E4311E